MADKELIQIFEKNGIKVQYKKTRRKSVKVRAGKRVIELKPDGSISECDPVEKSDKKSADEA